LSCLCIGTNAHRLIWLSDKEGIQDAVVEALFLAYFTEGRDISNQQTLINVVAEAGLDRIRAEPRRTATREWMPSRKLASRRSGFGVDGVPFIIVNSAILTFNAHATRTAPLDLAIVREIVLN